MKLEHIRTVKGNSLYVDGFLYNNLTAAAKNAKKYNGDLLIVIDGEEGSGKSTLGRQIAKILDPTFNEKRIAFSSLYFRRMAYETKEYRAIVLDESKEDLDRKSTMSKKNRMFMNFLSQARVLHKFMIVILPSVYDLDSYVAEHRAKMLLHTYKHRGRTPGFFTFYGKSAIKRLFITGKKYRTYNNVRGQFSGRFTKAEVVDMELYNQMKLRAVNKYSPDPDTKYNKEVEAAREEAVKEFQVQRFKEAMKNDFWKLPKRGIADVLGFSEQTLYNWQKKYST